MASRSRGPMSFRAAVVAAVAAVALLLMIGAAPATEAAKRPGCKKAGSKTLARNAVARVYEVGPRLVGCLRKSGRRVLLDRAYDDGYVMSGSYGDVRLNGTFAAWTWQTTDISCKAACPPGYDGTNNGISVQSLRRGKGRGVVNVEPYGGAFVVSSRGGLAWLHRDAEGSPVELRVSVRDGDDRVLDEGNIDPRSLRIELTIVSWLRDGAERFARLR